MKPLSNWRSVRMWESGVVRHLRQRRLLWLHGLCIGVITLGVAWGVSALPMHLGGEYQAVQALGFY